MDRRGFLKSGGAAAAVAGAATGAARSDPAQPDRPSAARPAVSSGVRVLSLAVAQGYDLPGFGTDRLAQRIEMAMDGRYRIERAGSSDAEPDLRFGGAHAEVALHPGFAFFAGLPSGEGVPASDLHAWLEVCGGQLLWDELAAEFGFKPLVAGHCGDGAGLWSQVRLEAISDLEGLPVYAAGLGARVMQSVGAEPVEAGAHELRAALANGRVLAAEWLGPLPAPALDPEPMARSLYGPGLHPHGTSVTLAVRKPVWDALSEADRAIFEACAAAEWRLALAETRLNGFAAGWLTGSTKWPVRTSLPEVLRAAFSRAAQQVVAEAGDHDPQTRRIADSFRAFRRLIGLAATA